VTRHNTEACCQTTAIDCARVSTVGLAKKIVAKRCIVGFRD
jgi:hypothetical protein